MRHIWYCNHYRTCGLACTEAVCGQCPAADKDQCSKTAGEAGHPCNAYAFGWACAIAAISGPGAFCNWEIDKDAGLWLDAVGNRYCK